jgi:hypothetical protein
MIATTLVATIFAFGVQLLIYGLAITVAGRSRKALEPEFNEAPR